MSAEVVLMKKYSTLLRIGIIGTILAWLGSFTPFLDAILGFIGLSALVGYLDSLLLPLLGLFICATVFALICIYQDS